MNASELSYCIVFFSVSPGLGRNHYLAARFHLSPILPSICSWVCLRISHFPPCCVLSCYFAYFVFPILWMDWTIHHGIQLWFSCCCVNQSKYAHILPNLISYTLETRYSIVKYWTYKDTCISMEYVVYLCVLFKINV